MIRFDVAGIPAPQGSKSRMPNGAIVEGRSGTQRARHRDWRAAVADAARSITTTGAGSYPYDGPVDVTIEFRFPMPVSRPKRVKDAGRAWKTSAPDLDKLVRATLDALVAGGLITDDARVAHLVAHKAEVIGWAGATITVARLEPLGWQR